MRYETSYIPERRGYGTVKGVPDAIVWCNIQDTVTNARWRFPILVELEPNFNNAIRDFQKFSERSLVKGDYLIIPISWKSDEHLFGVRCWEITYSLRECSVLTCCGDYKADEHDLYLQLRNLVNSSSFKADLKSLPLEKGNCVDVSWITWTLFLFGVKLECVLPMLRFKGSNRWLEREISERFRRTRLPCLVVTKSGEKNKRHLIYPTAIKFEAIS